VLHKVAKEHDRKAMVGIAYIDDRVYPDQEWNPLDQLSSGIFDYAANRWFREGMATGRSPEPFGDGEKIPGLKHSLDYIGLDFYGRDWGHMDAKEGYIPKTNPERQGTEPPFDYDGMYEMMLSTYNQLHVPVMITESGVDLPEPDKDNIRGRVLVDSFAAIHHAQSDGVPVLGYLHWTDWDNPEWQSGWTQHFGLFGFDPKTGRRWDKPAANTFEAISRRHAIPQQWLSAEDKQSPVERDDHAAHELDVLRQQQAAGVLPTGSGAPGGD
jgi:beta-glucosidase